MVQATPWNSCGTRHLKLAVWIIGLLLVVSVGISAGTAKYISSTAQATAEVAASEARLLDARVRAIETLLATVEPRVKNIEKTQDRIEDKLDALLLRKRVEP